MAKVTIKPDQKTIEVDSSQSLLDAIKNSSIDISFGCGGLGKCRDCLIKVQKGEEFLNSLSLPEQNLLGNVFHITKERLACQTYTTGDLVCEILNPPSQKQVKSRVRKKEEIKEIHSEREKKREEKRAKDDSWKNFWENKDEKNSSSAKKLGGGKRPRQMKVDYKEEVEKIPQKTHRPFVEKKIKKNVERKSFRSGENSKSRKE